MRQPQQKGWCAELRFDQGKLIFELSSSSRKWPETFQKMVREKWGSHLSFAETAQSYQFSGHHYDSLVLTLRELGIVKKTAAEDGKGLAYYVDHARGYLPVSFKLQRPPLREHQQLAKDAWMSGKGRGCVVLPTGAGKTLLALEIIAEIQRSTMVVVPTLDLMDQWSAVIKQMLGTEPALWGGGKKDLGHLTIITYDSALQVTPKHGHRFGLVIFDECHHLAAPAYQQIAVGTIAPYRLGLSATLEREDGRETELVGLIGPTVYAADIHQMSSSVLSPYDVITWKIPLSDRDQMIYDSERQIYLQFVRAAGISFGTQNGWQQFVFTASRSPQGRRALSAYRKQRRIACNSASKIASLWQIFADNPGEKLLIFTQDNELAYEIGRRYFLPVITHHTKKPERKAILASFHGGKIRCLVTSKVLNEGVDVPDASIGVVVSGTGSVREHVQRLGRILRHREGKRAKLYELVSDQTGEVNTKSRRRRHDAYQRTNKV